MSDKQPDVVKIRIKTGGLKILKPDLVKIRIKIRELKTLKPRVGKCDVSQTAAHRGILNATCQF